MSDFSDELIPWSTPKDYDPSKWDWSRPELRSQLRVGTVLESHDCSYVIVGSVTDEGVEDSVNGGFWPWSSLRSLGFWIYEQPDSTPETGRAVMPSTWPGLWVPDMGWQYRTAHLLKELHITATNARKLNPDPEALAAELGRNGELTAGIWTVDGDYYGIIPHADGTPSRRMLDEWGNDRPVTPEFERGLLQRGCKLNSDGSVDDAGYRQPPPTGASQPPPTGAWERIKAICAWTVRGRGWRVRGSARDRGRPGARRS